MLREASAADLLNTELITVNHDFIRSCHENRLFYYAPLASFIFKLFAFLWQQYSKQAQQICSHAALAATRTGDDYHSREPTLVDSWKLPDTCLHEV